MTAETKILHFETVSEFLDRALNAKPKEGFTSDNRSSIKSPKSFAGTDTVQEAADLARYGWPEGLGDMTSRIGMSLSTGRAKYRINDVSGDIPNIGRFLAGQPDSMTRRVIDMSMRRPIIDVTFASSFSAAVQGYKIMNYGAAVAMAIDELESAGFSVNLNICTLTTSGNLTGYTMCLKKAGEALELDKLVFFLAHPSYLRRLGFSIWETQLSKEALGSGYGMVADLKERPEGGIYFPKCNSGEEMDRTCHHMDGATKYVRKIIKQQRPDLFADDAEAA